MQFLSRFTTHFSRTYTTISIIIRQKFGNVSKNSLRNLSSRRSFRNEAIEKLKIKDNVPDQYELVYRNKTDKYLLYAQIFSTVFAGIVTVTLVVQRDFHNLAMDTSAWKTQPGSVENEVFVYFGMFVVVCTLLQIIVMKMPLRIYNYPKRKDYIVIFYGSLPGTTKRLTYKINEISKVEESGILPWRDSWYEIENKGKVILLENSFRTPADLNIMLGYQKSEEDDS